MESLLLNFANLCLSVAYGYSAVCRLDVIHPGVMLRVSWLYVVLFVLSVVSGLQFYILGTSAGWFDVAASGTICTLLLCNLPDWRDGPPCNAVRCQR